MASKSEAQKRSDRLARFSKRPGTRPDARFNLLLSPSRGDNLNEPSLRDRQVQDSFRKHLQSEVEAYERRFPDRLGSWKSPGKQRDALNNLLLEFRKLREGLVASGRYDALTSEVYETSIRLAILAQHDSTLVNTLPSLTRHYHNSSWLKSRPKDLEHGFESLSIKDDTDAHCFWASLALLHSICINSSKRQFCDLYRELTCPSTSIYAERIAPLPPSNTHLLLAQRLYRAFSRTDFVGIGKILQGDSLHELQRLLILRLALKMKASVWHIVCKTYLSIPRQRLGLLLLLDASPLLLPDATEELNSFLQTLPWSTTGDVIALRAPR